LQEGRRCSSKNKEYDYVACKRKKIASAARTMNMVTLFGRGKKFAATRTKRIQLI